MGESEDYGKTATPDAHKTTHQDGGTDEISVEGLAGELTAAQKSSWAKVADKPTTFTPEAHKTTHQDGGTDEISVEGLAGELTAAQKSSWAKVADKPTTFTPEAHKTTHQPDGSDDILAVPKSIFTTAGDLLVGTGAGTLARLAASASLKLFGNAAGNGLEYAPGIDALAFGRAMQADSGDVSYTGYLFKPSFVFFFGMLNNQSFSAGYDNITHKYVMVIFSTGPSYTRTSSGGIYLAEGAASQIGYLKSLDADGYTITWIKDGSPSAVTGAFFGICFR